MEGLDYHWILWTDEEMVEHWEHFDEKKVGCVGLDLWKRNRAFYLGFLGCVVTASPGLAFFCFFV